MDWDQLTGERATPQLDHFLDHEHPDSQLRNDSDDNDQQSEAEEAPARRVVPAEKKIKIVKNPRATLNPKRLTGPRGIQTIENVFQDFKFQGKSHEKEDLDMLMKKLEHWAHRLYPKFKYDDCLDKIATLGKKKEVATHIRRIRLDMLFDDNQAVDEENDKDETVNEEEPVLDEFDLLLNQQIALARSTPATTSRFSTVTPQNQMPEYPHTNMDELLVAPTTSNISDNAMEIGESVTNCKNFISVEQRERMLQNRINAEQRRLSRMKATMEQNKVVDINTETTP